MVGDPGTVEAGAVPINRLICAALFFIAKQWAAQPPPPWTVLMPAGLCLRGGIGQLHQSRPHPAHEPHHRHPLVQQLEARLRVKLLHRTTRSVQLICRWGRRITRGWCACWRTWRMRTRASPAPWPRPGAAAGGCAQPAGQPGLIPALPAFAQYPDIQLHLGVSDRVVDIVSDQVDCVGAAAR